MAETKDRLSEIMLIRDIRQVDLAKRCEPLCEKHNIKPFTAARICDWCKGRYQPNQWSLAVLGEALNVDEKWLMGYDVPMERRKFSTTTTEGTQILNKITCLNDENRELVMILIDRLLSLQGKKTKK